MWHLFMTKIKVEVDVKNCNFLYPLKDVQILIQLYLDLFPQV